MILGGDYIADGAELTPQLDSETRFLSAIALGVGVGALWLFRSFEREPRAAVLLASFALLGGLTRILSMATVGMPGTTAVVATAIEIVIRRRVLFLLTRRS